MTTNDLARLTVERVIRVNKLRATPEQVTRVAYDMLVWIENQKDGLTALAAETQAALYLEVELEAEFQTPTVAELIEIAVAKKAQGVWVPANGGTETPFLSRSGKRLLYCWQPSTGNHAYLDMGTDRILTQEEADAAMMLY